MKVKEVKNKKLDFYPKFKNPKDYETREELEQDFNELLSLVDGAYDIVFLVRNSEHKSQVEWSKAWCERASKFGASLE